ncbi:ADP-ribosylglycohydrolase family protein [Pelatocladus sp. BLCC-F211]|uniref:ADP-ribosylglycohydrolase family protein n=1 Tax=Pelatocladus sp. BLCC-F211 TaxID=3342752 RepID=UPI0035B7CBDA
MRYSLASRTRGTILGALIGEILALEGGQMQKFASSYWQKMMITGAESLIELGRFDLDDWSRRQQESGIIVENNTHASLQVILSTLPVILFFHEHNIKLRQNLLNVVKIWHSNPVIEDWTLAVGYAIAQSFREKLTSSTLIPQIIGFLEETPTSVPQILLKLHNLLEKQAGLEIIQAEFCTEEKLSYDLAIAFYCFVSSLEDFRLSVLRATKVNSPSVYLSTITAALSGAYNATTGIPVSWRFLLAKNSPAQWQTTDLPQMVKLTDTLVATWSGVYHSTLNQGEVRAEWPITLSYASLEAITAPRVIRLR